MMKTILAGLLSALAVSCGISDSYQSQRPTFRKRDASFFIVNEPSTSSWQQARQICPNVCLEEGGKWTGAWSSQSPFQADGGTCECSEAQTIQDLQVSVEQAPMSMEEMKATFDIPQTPTPLESMQETPSHPQNKSSASNQVPRTQPQASQSSAGGDVSATVTRDPKTGTVTATAQAGRARAESRSSPSGEVSATIHRDPKTGTVTASASAGSATATASSRRDPFDI